MDPVTGNTAGGAAGRTRRGVGLACLAAAVLLGGWYLAEGRWLMALAVGGASAAVYLAFRLPPGRYLVFATAAVALSTLATLGAVGVLDVYLHHRYEDRGGFNIWGYRGATLPSKAPGERRVAVLGGSTAFGYGVGVDETIPAYLERDLAGRLASTPVHVVNLAWNGQGARSFRFNLQAYDYLDYDTVVLYSGYNDLFYNPDSFREQSAIFRLTGYLPILPVVPVREWLHIGDLSDTRDERVVFEHTLKERYAAEAADTALRISRELERQIGRLTPEAAASDPSASPSDCGERWGFYCGQIHDAVSYALTRGKTVFVVTQPYISDQHVAQQSALAGMLRRQFADDPRVHYVNLGRTLALTDRTLCYDGMHLTPAGNARVADALAAAIAEAGR
ncbi:MAG: SGNH/GDSL hydrolase family protein [Vicinamibacterales bacterium]